MVDTASTAQPRRRSFVAGGARPLMPAFGETLPELPVLTEIVEPANLPPTSAAEPCVPMPTIDPEAVQAMARDMAQGLAQQMAEQLAEELAQDRAQALAQQMARGMAESMAQEMAQGIAESMAQEMARELAQPIAQEMAQDIAQSMAQDLAQGMAQTMAGPMAEELAQGLARDMAQRLAPEMAQAQLAEILPARRQQAAGAVTDWLDAELPAIVTRVVDGLADHIVAQVTLDVNRSLLARLDAAFGDISPVGEGNADDAGAPAPGSAAGPD